MFIPLVLNSIIIIGSRFAYTFGSRFTYKRWVRVLSKIWILAFLGKYSNIFVGSQSVSIEIRNIYQYFCWVSKHIYWGSHHFLSLLFCSISFTSVYQATVQTKKKKRFTTSVERICITSTKETKQNQWRESTKHQERKLSKVNNHN